MLRAALATPVAAALLAAASARGDGLALDGDEPAFPHVWLKLEGAQRDALDHPPPDELARARGLADPALASAAPAAEPTVRAAAPGTIPPLVARAQGLLPDGRFARLLPVSGGWQAVSVRRAPLPEALEDLADAALGVTAERQLEVHPTGGSSAAWPASGARWLAPDGTALYALPHVLRGESGPPLRAWLLLAYREGLLVEHALVAERDVVAGATYAWEE